MLSSRIAFLAFSLAVLLGACLSPEAMARPGPGIAQEAALDSDLNARLQRLADDFVQGRFSGDLSERYLDAAMGALGDEPQPLDANLDVSRQRFIVHRVDRVRLEGPRPPACCRSDCFA